MAVKFSSSVLPIHKDMTINFILFFTFGPFNLVKPVMFYFKFVTFPGQRTQKLR